MIGMSRAKFSCFIALAKRWMKMIGRDFVASCLIGDFGQKSEPDIVSDERNPTKGTRR